MKTRAFELNPIHKPTPGFMDETRRLWCAKCHNWLNAGWDMCQCYDPAAELIAHKHLELCTGELGTTLIAMETWCLNGGRQELEKLATPEPESPKPERVLSPFTDCGCACHKSGDAHLVPCCDGASGEPRICAGCSKKDFEVDRCVDWKPRCLACKDKAGMTPYGGYRSGC
jgi:hypothetical protein